MWENGVIIQESLLQCCLTLTIEGVLGIVGSQGWAGWDLEAEVGLTDCLTSGSH